MTIGYYSTGGLSSNFGGCTVPPGCVVDLISGTNNPCFSFFANTITIAQGCVAIIGYGAQWMPFGDLPANNGSVTMWVQNDSTGEKFGNSGLIPVIAGQANQISGTAANLCTDLPGGASYHIWYLVGSGTVGIRTGTYTVNTQSFGKCPPPAQQIAMNVGNLGPLSGAGPTQINTKTSALRWPKTLCERHIKLGF